MRHVPASRELRRHGSSMVGASTRVSSSASFCLPTLRLFPVPLIHTHHVQQPKFLLGCVVLFANSATALGFLVSPQVACYVNVSCVHGFAHLTSHMHTHTHKQARCHVNARTRINDEAKKQNTYTHRAWDLRVGAFVVAQQK